jgi:hypothetical protein
MKYTTVHLDENKIELFNTLLGKETVKVNGEIVSEKRSITGTEHIFKINEDGNENTYKLTTGFNINGVGFSLYKNDKPIIEMPKSKLAIYVFIIIGIVVGYSILGK